MRLVYTLLFLSFAPLAHATPIVVDVGTPGTYFEKRGLALPAFNGTALQGQTLSFDIVFTDSVTILPGQYDWDFDLGLSFATNARNIVVGFASGTGYITDAAGNRLCGVRPLGSIAYYDQSSAGFGVGLSPFLLNKNGTIDPSLSTPLTFYGAHFNITLPDSPYFMTGGEVDFFAQQTRYAHGFRIGVHVPDSGKTAVLFSITLAALAIANRARLRSVAHCAFVATEHEHPESAAHRACSELFNIERPLSGEMKQFLQKSEERKKHPIG